MSMNWDVTSEKDFLHARVTGDFSLTEANDMLVDVFQALIQHGHQKVLIDCRRLKGEMTTLERFVHATFAVQEMNESAAAGVSRATRFAYVGEEPLIDRARFGETVALNRGLNVMVAVSMEKALQWLEIDPAHKTVKNQKK